MHDPGWAFQPADYFYSQIQASLIHMIPTFTFPASTPLEQRPRAILIGASSGIGAALARRLAQEGYLLALLARRADNLQALCQEINRAAGETRAVAYVHDVTDFAAIPALFQRILGDLRSIDLLVYNAGVLYPVEFSEYNFDKDKKMVDVNLLGAMAWLGQAAALFEQQGSGQIVGISSVAGDRGRSKNPGYGAAKAGFTAYLESLRNRLSRSGVSVVTIKPGFVDTEMTAGEALPMIISAEQAAADIYKAIRKRQQTRYVPLRWGLIMLVIMLIPSILFRRLKI